MLKDFVAHASLLVTSFFIIGHLFKSRPIGSASGWRLKLAVGLCFGLQGVVLMFYSIRIDDSTIVDLRQLSTIIAAMYGGPIPALVSAVVIAGGRILLFGGFSYPAVTAALCMLAIGVVCSAMVRRRAGLSVLRFLLLHTVSMLLVSAVIYSNLSHNGNHSWIPSVLAYQWVVSSGVGVLSIYIFYGILQMHEYTRKLRESEERYRKLIAASPDATFVLSGQTIVFVNKKGFQLLGAAVPKEVLGRSIFDFVNPSYRDIAANHWDEILSDKEVQELLEQKFVRIDGEEIDVELSVSSILYENQEAYLATFREITDRKRTEQKLQEALGALQKLSDLDGLTGIANRRKLDHFLHNAWVSASENQQPLYLILYDVDYFKRYNDTYGHQRGDEVLRAIARTVEEVFQMASSSLVARYGGEEFAAVIPAASKEAAVAIAEMLRIRVEALGIPHEQSKISGRVTISLGIAALTPDPADPSSSEKDLIDMADKALYRAKAEGRNRVCLYMPIA